MLADPAIEKVFHAAEYDLICLKRDYGFEVNHLFDTMVAARICGRKEMGLSKLLAEFCGVVVDKNHQRDDWGERPLPEEGLRYAQMDTHYLPELRDKLTAELASLGSLTEAQETFQEYQKVTVAERVFDPEGYWRIGIPASLKRRQMAILRELYLLREELAQERDIPPFKIMGDRVMILLSEEAPSSMHNLMKIKGLAGTQAQRYGKQMLEAIERGRHSQISHPPARPPEIDPVVMDRFNALRDWRKLRAERRGVESDVIVSKDVLWGLAFKAPATVDELHNIRGLGPWRIETYGAEILDVLKSVGNSA